MHTPQAMCDKFLYIVVLFGKSTLGSPFSLEACFAIRLSSELQLHLGALYPRSGLASNTPSIQHHKVDENLASPTTAFGTKFCLQESAFYSTSLTSHWCAHLALANLTNNYNSPINQQQRLLTFSRLLNSMPAFLF